MRFRKPPENDQSVVVSTHEEPARLSRVPRAVYFVVIVLAFGLIGSQMTKNSLAETFEDLGMHPAAAQRSESGAGKGLRTLKAWNGKIYAGYGDSAIDMEPVQMSAFDARSSRYLPSEHTADTEAVEIMRLINNQLYIPSVSPRCCSQLTVGAASGDVATWSSISQGSLKRTYDVATLTGADLYISGSIAIDSTTDHAKIYKSTDGGQSWSDIFTATPQMADVARQARFYFMAPLAGKLYVQAVDDGGQAHGQAWVYDGASWSSAAPITSSTRPYNANEFGSYVLLQTDLPEKGGNLIRYNGQDSEEVLSGVRNYIIAPDGWVYVLKTNREIVKSKDLVTWDRVIDAPLAGLSLEIYGEHIYVGGSDGRLYRAQLP